MNFRQGLENVVNAVRRTGRKSAPVTVEPVRDVEIFVSDENGSSRFTVAQAEANSTVQAWLSVGFQVWTRWVSEDVWYFCSVVDGEFSESEIAHV